MRRILAALIFMSIGAGCMYAAFQFHVVQSKEGWMVIRKTHVGLQDTYADIRKWQATTWKKHPKLAQSLVDNGKGSLIIQSASNGLFDGLFQNPKKKRSAAKNETSTNRL